MSKRKANDVGDAQDAAAASACKKQKIAAWPLLYKQAMGRCVVQNDEKTVAKYAPADQCTEAEDKCAKMVSKQVHDSTTRARFGFWHKDPADTNRTAADFYAELQLHCPEGAAVIATARKQDQLIRHVAPFQGISLFRLLAFRRDECRSCGNDSSAEPIHTPLRLKPENAFLILANIAGSCEFLRVKCGLDQGDLSLGNLLATPTSTELKQGVLTQPCPRLIDFGLSRSVDRALSTNDTSRKIIMDLLQACPHGSRTLERAGIDDATDDEACWLVQALDASEPIKRLAHDILMEIERAGACSFEAFEKKLTSAAALFASLV